jgi:hypothetical protein
VISTTPEMTVDGLINFSIFPEIFMIGLTGQKMKIFNFEIEEKLDLHIDVKSDGNGLETQKSYLVPLN